jgi:cysteine dioxygenase
LIIFGYTLRSRIFGKMNQITSLPELIETLNECDPQDYVKIAANMNLPKDEFEDYAFWNDDCYARNCIERTDVFELILICWKPGDETPVHGHDEQKCWIYQVDGNMYEERFQEEDGELVSCNQMVLSPGRLSYMEDGMGYHSLENKSSDDSMTLHLYISPIDCCQVFDPSEEEFCEKELKYDSFKGVLTEDLVS